MEREREAHHIEVGSKLLNDSMSSQPKSMSQTQQEQDSEAAPPKNKFIPFMVSNSHWIPKPQMSHPNRINSLHEYLVHGKLKYHLAQNS